MHRITLESLDTEARAALSSELKADGDPAELTPKLATPEEMARLLRVAEYQHWSDAYLN